MHKNSITSLLVAGLVLAGLSGCSTFQKKDDNLLAAQPKKTLAERMPWSKSKNDKPEPYPNPVKLASTWTPDTLTQTGRVTTRGFGARMFFYDEKSRPVPVEGTLVVHAFDEQNSGPGGQPAVKRYEFTPEQFTRHFSKTDLGASYSVWIPWDAVGGKQTRVSLVASFSTTEGKTVQGAPTTVLLPGAKDSAATALAQRFAPEYREWRAAASGNSPPTSGLTTTTIHRSATPTVSTPSARPSIAPESSTWNLAGGASGNSFDIAMKPKPTTTPSSPSMSTGTPVMPASTRLK